MLRTKLAKKVLTKKEQRHLTKDANIHTMATMREQVDFMKKHPPGCFDCKRIARKLNLIT